MAVNVHKRDDTKRPVAVFDYDGTCIDGQSGSVISRWLLFHGYLSPYTVVGLSWWGIRYKLHLPFRQERARELIFRDLGKLDPQEVKQILARIHREALVPLYRPQALAEIARRRGEGCVTLLVSATFDTIASEAAKYLGVDGFAATQMELDENGRFTGRVEGPVTAGSSKVETTLALAQSCVGGDQWYLAYAYGDHHTDEELLETAEHPCAVSPGPTLRREARRRGWPIVDWSLGPRGRKLRSLVSWNRG